MVGDISIGTIVAAYIFFIDLFLVGAYIISYAIDRKMYTEDRKTIKLKCFRLLFVRYEAKKDNIISISTFVHELFTIILLLVSLISMTISFFVNDVVKLILFISCFILTAILTGYLSVKDNKLKKKKSN